MTPLEEKATQLSRDEIVALLVSQQELTTRVEEQQRQLEWFKRQLFGSKSERRLAAVADGRQLYLGEQLAQEPKSETPTETVRSYARRRSHDDKDDASDELTPRFDSSVPVEEIHIPNPEIENLPPERYDIVGEKVTLRLAQECATLDPKQANAEGVSAADRESPERARGIPGSFLPPASRACRWFRVPPFIEQGVEGTGPLYPGFMDRDLPSERRSHEAFGSA